MTQVQSRISKESEKYYTKIINRSKVRIFQHNKDEGKEGIHLAVKGSIPA